MLQTGASPARALYTSGCDTHRFGGLKYVNERERSNPGLKGAIIELDARMLVPCTPGVLGFFTSISATLQSGKTTQSNIVHVGIIRCSKPGGCGGDSGTGAGEVPDDGHLHFFYTKYDDTGGRIYLADGWYGAAPTIGDRYRLKIQRLASDWRYYIRNVTDDQACVTHDGATPTWSTSTDAWWGGEVHSAADAMGNRDSDPDLDSQMQYLRDGVWYQTNGADQVCLKYKDDEGLSFPSYYRCAYTTQGVSRDTMLTYTLDHSEGDIP